MGYEVRRSLASKTLDELADWASTVGPGSENDQTVKAEFLRRQTALQVEVTQATKDTAASTRRSAHYLLASVIAILISALISAFFSGLQYQDAHDQLRFATKPSVDFDVEDEPSAPPMGIAIENGGPGPATIKSISIYVDRKPVKDWKEATDIAKINANHTMHFDFDLDDTLAVNEKDWLIQLKHSANVNPNESNEFANFIDDRVGIEVFYCSKLGECGSKCSTNGRCSER